MMNITLNGGLPFDTEEYTDGDLLDEILDDLLMHWDYPFLILRLSELECQLSSEVDD